MMYRKIKFKLKIWLLIQKLYNVITNKEKIATQLTDNVIAIYVEGVVAQRIV